ncbi:MAG TPA: kynureninase [Caulobacteraceae bacterium]|jgi:kynureninase
MSSLTKDDCETLDRSDPLAAFRDEFVLPDGMTYLDGHSLGPMPKAALERLNQAASTEWARGLIGSWNIAGWFQQPYRLGAKIAPLIGVAEDEVVVTDTVVANLFKVAASALALRPGRKVIVMEGSNFPTDNYIVQGLIGLLDRGYEIRFAEKAELMDALDETVAVAILIHVHYKTSHVLDMAAITQRAHEVGALMVWDLCHSVGAVPVDLNAVGADYAVGCTYKYLNGGPGSPAFVFAARRHHGGAIQPLTGWWGHEAPFAFDRDYRPAGNINQMLTSTQPILSLAAMEAGLDLAGRADRVLARDKARALGDLLIRLMDERCGEFDFKLISPRTSDQRGQHVAFDHPQGYPIVRALAQRGVITDFRAPETIRFGLAPLYIRFADVWNAVADLVDIMQTRAWDHPDLARREAVT